MSEMCSFLLTGVKIPGAPETRHISQGCYLKKAHNNRKKPAEDKHQIFFLTNDT